MSHSASLDACFVLKFSHRVGPRHQISAVASAVHLQSLNHIDLVSMSLVWVSVLLCFCASPILASNLLLRQTCDGTFYPCSPPGSLDIPLPALGSGLAALFVALVDSANLQSPSGNPTSSTPPASSNQPAKRADEVSNVICCRWSRRISSDEAHSFTGASTTTCVLLRDYNVPMCYVSVSQGQE